MNSGLASHLCFHVCRLEHHNPLCPTFGTLHSCSPRFHGGRQDDPRQQEQPTEAPHKAQLEDAEGQ